MGLLVQTLDPKPCQGYCCVKRRIFGIRKSMRRMATRVQMPKVHLHTYIYIYVGCLELRGVYRGMEWQMETTTFGSG